MALPADMPVSTRIVIWGCGIIPIAALIWLVIDSMRVMNAIREKNQYIHFDSGAYYLILLTSLLVIFVCHRLNLSGKQRAVDQYGGKMLIGVFVVGLILANVLPLYFKSLFNSAGYHACDDPRSISRTARGSSVIYALGSCPDS